MRIRPSIFSFRFSFRTFAIPVSAILVPFALAANVAAEIVIVEMRTVDSHPVFVPAEVSIEPGDTVRWLSLDQQTEHGTCNGGGSADPAYGTLWQSSLLRYGEYFDYTFTQVGEYEYFSVPHEYEGMLGLVRVGSTTDVPDQRPTTWGKLKSQFAKVLPRD
ncbi:MAG: hypothetical protein DHS20C21_04460 [Gemmatimonadota bacterium]|nr:MAG: hypothetical protein DHS20C21_04460 [Gemmatimonadota bacterium]